MSIVAVPNFNQSLVKPQQAVCYDNNLVNSQGIFLGDHKPLMYSLPLFLLEISFIFLTTSATHYVLKRFDQSRFVSQLVTGMLLGPSIIGSSEFQYTMFPDRGTFILDTVSFTSLIFFIFTISVKTDLTLLRKPGRLAIGIGIIGSILPIILALTFFSVVKSSFPVELHDGQLIVRVIFRLSLTSFAVVADILDELKLLNTELGRITMSAALITDMINWVITAINTTYGFMIKMKTPSMAIAVLASFVFFICIVLFVARPAVLRTVRKTPDGEMLKEGHFIGLILLALATALATEVMGFHSILGPFMLGLLLPGGMPIGVTLSEKLESLLIVMLLPTYMVLAGFRTDFKALGSLKAWGAMEIVVLICYVGKFLGSIVVALYYKMPVRDAASVALMMNAKGIVEVYFVNMWSDEEVANATHFSILIISMLLVTAISTPLVSFLYNPTARYIANKRRTIQHHKPHSPLRILVAVHNEENVASILDLLEASALSRKSPLSLTLLHLTELVGHAVSTLGPYKLSHRSITNPSAFDRIVNAFRYFEQKATTSSVTIHPFVAVAPSSTMHNDICSLALDKKVDLILLPFHRQSDGAQLTTNHRLQSINRKVLDYAPCSVAILVDHDLHVGTTCAHTNSLMQHIAVYFLGGGDDREALAYASRMADNPAIALTVVRFLPSEDMHINNDDMELKLDEAALHEFKDRQIQNTKVVYIEKVVDDGEGTVQAINGMSDKFDMLIVGRRQGMQSALTSGLSEWSECPELGIIGDLLASTEFNDKVSVLVVQQQSRLNRNEDEVELFDSGGNYGGGVEMMRS